MKSIALVALGVLLGVAVMLAVPHGPPQIVFADPPSGNGDVNGSGKIDLADAIYLLGYLFANGPEPEAIECDTCCTPVCPPQVLPATGQTRCYDTIGDVIDCASADYPGQDGYYQAGCPMADRFVDNGDGTVTDNCTGLMWQKETAPGLYSLQNALKYCENLTLAGHGDWRLPNVRELQSLVDYGRYNPSIDRVFGAVSSWYWSSSVIVEARENEWIVDFYTGYVLTDHKPTVIYVRAVRDAD